MRALANLAAAALAASLLAGALASCGQTYQEIGLFNCPEDHSCPEGMACVLLNGTEQCVQKHSCDLFTPASCQGATGGQYTLTRCALMMTNPALVEAQCVEQYGAAPEGTACQQLYAQNQGIGGGITSTDFPVEDRFCANGSICHSFSMQRSYVGVTNGNCRRFCKADGDCASAQRCLDAFSPAVTAATVSISPRPGVCYPSCTLMSAASGCANGEQCTIGLDVAASSGFGLCQTPGNATTDQTCGGSVTCAAGLACIPVGSTFQCQKLCRISGPGTQCLAGKSCKATGLVLPDADVGVCG
jgi:hypothetical protein